jgi:hypothetical protein
MIDGRPIDVKYFKQMNYITVVRYLQPHKVNSLIKAKKPKSSRHTNITPVFIFFSFDQYVSEVKQRYIEHYFVLLYGGVLEITCIYYSN